MEATTRDLRLHTAQVLSAVDRGEAVIITYRGKRRALLTRWHTEEEDKRREGRNPAFGLWIDHKDDVARQVRKLRQGRELP